VKAFISWSGDRSRDVAVALGDWLPQVLNAVEPFVSTRDLAAGARWAIEIAERLEETDFGIVCVTKENQLKPWLNYEAGAIAKAVAASRVVPLAIDLAPADIVHPLGQFQGTEATREGISEIVGSMNEACPSSRPEMQLQKAFEKWWPDLEAELQQIKEKAYPQDAATPVAPRKDREILEEVLQTVRGFARRTPADVSRPPSDNEGLANDIRTLLRASGIRGWSASFGPGSIQLRVNDQVTPELLEELSFLGKLRNIDIEVDDSDGVITTSG
jgi:hypothetical protein